MEVFQNFRRQWWFRLTLSCTSLQYNSWIKKFRKFNIYTYIAVFQKTRAQNLTELGPRIKYVLQHATPGVAWLLFCFFYVITKRVGTPAVDPTSGNERRVEVAQKILQNSLEQFAMLFACQLILVTYLTGKQTLNVVPLLNILFIVGRIFFFLGYPKYRGFGFTLGFVPLFIAIAYTSYRYVKLFGLWTQWAWSLFSNFDNFHLHHNKILKIT